MAILYVLYHLPESRPALAEAHRVMRSGGLIAVSAPSRHDSPELAQALPKTPLTFDAELAPGLLRELFEEPEVLRWDTRRVWPSRCRFSRLSRSRQPCCMRGGGGCGHAPLRWRRWASSRSWW